MIITIKPQTINVSAEPKKLSTPTGIPVARAYINVDPYEGAYTITPSAETQTIPIMNKRATDNITIEPIPQNYGLITWNGVTLTVS